MSLCKSYKIVKPSIVAFCPKYIPVGQAGPPLFPPIIGTGFIVDSNGVIATNDHVISALDTLRPKDVPAEDWGFYAILLYSSPAGQLEIPLEVIGVGRVGQYNPGKVYYGPSKPDVAFVHVDAIGLPSLKIDEDVVVNEGMELATAGFPMGTDALTAPGYIHQVTPTLQAGIVSAILPFSCTKPHAYMLNVMTQGGASGSPVFDPTSGSVVGILYAGLNDVGLTGQRDKYTIPTNISYVVPKHILHESLVAFMANPEVCVHPGAKSIAQRIAESEIVNILEKGHKWEVREIRPRGGSEASKPIREVKRTE